MVPTLDSILNDMTRIKPLDQSLAHDKRSMNVTDSYSVEQLCCHKIRFLEKTSLLTYVRVIEAYY